MNDLEQFLEMEEKNQLFQREIDGWKYWHYMRWDFFYQRNKKLPQTKAVRTWEEVSTRWKYILKKELPNKPCDFLFFIGGRYLSENGKYKSIIADPVANYLSQEGYSCRLYQNYYLGNSRDVLKERPEILVDIFTKEIAGICFRFKCYSRKREELFKEEISFLEKIFQEELHDSIDVAFFQRQFRHFYLNYKIGKRYYQKKLKKIKPKIVFEDNHYENHRMIMTEAAKELGIPVVELQHGIIGNKHTAFNFKKQHSLPSFPDFIFTYSEYWNRSARYPINENNLKAVGYPHLEHNVKKYTSSKNSKIILIISQGPVAKKVVELATSLQDHIEARQLQYQIMFKFHPNEIVDDSVYRPLHEKSDVIKLVHFGEKTLYECFAEAGSVLGFYSTSLFESMIFGLTTIIYENEKKDQFREFVESGYAVFVNSPEEIINSLEHNENFQNKEGLLKKNALDNMKNEIEEIIG